MYEKTENPKKNKGRPVADSFIQKKNNAKKGFSFVDNRAESVTQLMLWPKKKDKQREILDEYSSVDGKTVEELYRWCNDIDEFEYFLQHIECWKEWKDKEGVELHNRKGFEGFMEFNNYKKTGEVIGGEKVKEKIPEKKKTEPLTFDEMQIRIGLEYEERLKKQKEELRSMRLVEYNKTNYSVISSYMDSDNICGQAWGSAINAVLSGSNNNLSLSIKPTFEDLEKALVHWLSGAHLLVGNGIITDISKFPKPVDKSQRDDGGMNSVNLVKRTWQASFIIYTTYGNYNVHVDCLPPK